MNRGGSQNNHADWSLLRRVEQIGLAGSGDVVGVARHRVAGEAGFEVTCLRRPGMKLEATMSDLTWPIIIFAILCALVWRKHREKQGKKVSWYTDLLVAGGLAFAGNFMIRFGETFIASFTRSFKRSSGGADPSTGTVYLVLAAFFLILAVLVTVFVLGVRYIWKLWKLRHRNKTMAGL